jgi:hypothetical protein
MNIPKTGALYYHKKHDPQLGINHHTYRIVGVGFNTENQEEVFVGYRPLYKQEKVYEVQGFNLRPLAMFMEPGRFIEITDPTLIAELEKIEKELYNS